MELTFQRGKDGDNDHPYAPWDRDDSRLCWQASQEDGVADSKYDVMKCHLITSLDFDVSSLGANDGIIPFRGW